MEHVSILAEGLTSVVTVGDTHQMPSRINEFFQQTHSEPLLALQLAGLQKQTRQTDGLFTINHGVISGRYPKQI
jgi:hypothetical protein